MIKTILNTDGSVNGFWDEEANCWVPASTAAPEIADVDLTSLTKDQLRTLLEERGIEFSPKDNKDDLIRRFGPVA